jgi:hypothetical protein
MQGMSVMPNRCPRSGGRGQLWLGPLVILAILWLSTGKVAALPMTRLDSQLQTLLLTLYATPRAPDYTDAALAARPFRIGEDNPADRGLYRVTQVTATQALPWVYVGMLLGAAGNADFPPGGVDSGALPV